jgi:hypothetical protein
MDYGKFGHGFWHPFGPHGKETPEEIIDRKRKEIEVNDWTLWSFQYRRLLVLEAWRGVLLAGARPHVFVFCSTGCGAVDPARSESGVETLDCPRE